MRYIGQSFRMIQQGLIQVCKTTSQKLRATQAAAQFYQSIIIYVHYVYVKEKIHPKSCVVASKCDQALRARPCTSA